MGQARHNPRSVQYRGTRMTAPTDGPRREPLGVIHQRLIPTTPEYSKDKDGKPLVRRLKPGTRFELSRAVYEVQENGSVRRVDPNR